MNPFDETPQSPQDPAPPGDPAPAKELLPEPVPVADSSALPQQEAPFLPTVAAYPEDLQITWSWPHFVLFIFFGFASLIFIQGVLAAHYVPRNKHLTTSQLQEYLLSKPQFAIGSMLIWYAAIFFFLYVTLSVLRGRS